MFVILNTIIILLQGTQVFQTCCKVCTTIHNKIYTGNAALMRRGMMPKGHSVQISTCRPTSKTPVLHKPPNNQRDSIRGMLCRHRWSNRQRRHLLNLPDQEALLVDELFIFSAVLEERGQEAQKLLAIAHQYFLHRDGLVRVCHKHLNTLDHPEHVPRSQRTLKTWKPS